MSSSWHTVAWKPLIATLHPVRDKSGPRKQSLMFVFLPLLHQMGGVAGRVIWPMPPVWHQFMFSSTTSQCGLSARAHHTLTPPPHPSVWCVTSGSSPLLTVFCLITSSCARRWPPLPLAKKTKRITWQQLAALLPVSLSLLFLFILCKLVSTFRQKQTTHTHTHRWSNLDPMLFAKALIWVKHQVGRWHHRDSTSAVWGQIFSCDHVLLL